MSLRGSVLKAAMIAKSESNYTRGYKARVSTLGH